MDFLLLQTFFFESTNFTLKFECKNIDFFYSDEIYHENRVVIVFFLFPE